MKIGLFRNKKKDRIAYMLFALAVFLISFLLYRFIMYSNMVGQEAVLIILQVVFILVTVFVLIVYLKQIMDEALKNNEELLIVEKKYNYVFGRSDKIFFEYKVLDGSIILSEKFEKQFKRRPVRTGLPYSALESRLVHPESTSSFLGMFEDVKKGIPSVLTELRIKDGTGKFVWCLVHAVTIFDKNKIPLKCMGEIEVISEKKELEIKYNEVQKYKSAIDSENIVICEVNLTRNYYMSGYEELLAMSSIESANNYSNIIRLIARDYFHIDNMNEFMLKNNPSNLISLFLSGITDTAFEYRMVDSSTNEKWLYFKYKLYESPATKDICTIISIMDISEKKRKEAELINKAERDQMSGLYNKTTTEKLIDEWMQNNRSSFGALLMIDIDNFKNINDKLGHLYGDMILKKLSEGLMLMFRANDIVGRIGGDEFFVFIKKMGSEELVSAKANEICKLFHNVYHEKDISCEISSSVGIALFPKHGNTLDALYRNADKALYHRKEKGKDGYTIFNEEIEIK